MPSDPPAPGAILDLMLADLKATALKAALDLRLWEKIARGARTAAEIARVDSWDEEGAGMLLDALCGMDFLTKAGEEYELNALSEWYLLPDRPTYMGDLVLAGMPGSRYREVSEAVRTGRRPAGAAWSGDQAADLWTAWTAPRLTAPERDLDSMDALWERLGIRPAGGLRVLDVGCGSGIKTLALARRNPRIQVCLQDWPPVLESAWQIADALGVGSQVELLPGDAGALDFGECCFDLAWMGHLAHYFGPDGAAGLFRRVHAALAPGGALILHEDVANEGRRAPEYPLLESLWLFLVTEEGKVYTYRELEDFLRQAGFAEVRPAVKLDRLGEVLIQARKALEGG